MSNINEDSKTRKALLQEWMDAIGLALEHVPAGHQMDLARRIIEEHYPYHPDLSFMSDRGEIMLWAASQEVLALADTLEVVVAEIGSRRVPEAYAKLMLKNAWDNLSDGPKRSFMEWAKKEMESE